MKIKESEKASGEKEKKKTESFDHHMRSSAKPHLNLIINALLDVNVNRKLGVYGH